MTSVAPFDPWPPTCRPRALTHGTHSLSTTLSWLAECLEPPHSIKVVELNRGVGGWRPLGLQTSGH